MGDHSNHAAGHCLARQCYSSVNLNGFASGILCTGSLVTRRSAVVVMVFVKSFTYVTYVCIYIYTHYMLHFMYIMYIIHSVSKGVQYLTIRGPYWAKA